MEFDSHFPVVFGQNNEIVFHSQMSLDYQMQLMSNILNTYTELKIDPYSKCKFDFYSFVYIRKLLNNLFGKLNHEALKVTEKQPISEINWLSKNQSGILNSLEDVRDATFKTMSIFRLQTYVSIDNDPFILLNMPNNLDRIWLTPHFIENFDIKGYKCKVMLENVVEYKSICLGFYVVFQNSGNTD